MTDTLQVAAAAASLSMADADIVGGNDEKKKLPLMAMLTFGIAAACGTFYVRVLVQGPISRAFLFPLFHDGRSLMSLVDTVDIMVNSVGFNALSYSKMVPWA